MILTLHGFLGSPQDWNHLHIPNQKIESLDLVHEMKVSKSKNLLEMAKHLNSIAQDYLEFQNEESIIIMGYSLGCRIAYHMLLQKPELYSRAIFISGHPGLTSVEEKSERLLSDQKIAKKLKSISSPELPEFWEWWNRQEIFKTSSQSFKRSEFQYLPEDYAHLLEYFSLGTQQNLRTELKNLKTPAQWIMGEKDLKYLQIFKEFVPPDQLTIIPNAGHRVIFDNPNWSKTVF